MARYQSTFTLALLAAALLALAACGVQPAAPAATAAPQATAAATAAPQPTAVATAAPQPTAVARTPGPAELAAALKQFVEAKLPPTPTATDSLTPTYHISGVQVLPLRVDDPARPLWAVASLGAPTLSVQPHFVALYERAGAEWRELSRVDLANPPVLHNGALEQVALVPGRLWLLVRGESGLTGSCCVDVLSFDGAALRNELSFNDRTLINVAVEPVDQAPAVVITVLPWRGASSPPGPEERHVFAWDGARLVEQAEE